MFALWRAFGRAVGTVSNLAGYASGVLIVFCSGVLVFEVAVRYLLNWPTDWVAGGDHAATPVAA